jgi:hypothetical protein
VYLFEVNPRFWVSMSASVWCGLNFLAENLEREGQSDDVRFLETGTADTFYHPLFRPALWPYVLFHTGRRGRMSRLMARDMCTLGSQLRTFWINGLNKVLPPGVSSPASPAWKN